MFGVHGSSDIRTYVSNSGALLTSGTVADLATEQLAFLRVDKKGVGLPDQPQAKPTARTSPFFKIGLGRAPYAAQQALQANESKFPWFTREIRGRDIVKWEGNRADPNSQTEMWALGYDGVDANKRLADKIDYHELIIGVRLWGGPIRKLTGNSPWLQRYYHVDKGCIDKCLDVCETNPGLADDYIADEILRKYNADKYNNVFISKFARASKLRKPAVSEDPIEVVSATEFSITLCDDGSNSALGNIQAQYPGYRVEFSSRVAANSTYTMWRPDAAGDPASFVNTAPIALAVCSVCPSGYTLVAEQDVYTIERPVAPGTDLSTNTAKQTYADSIGTAYAASERGVITITGGTGGTGYTNGTFPLTISGGGGSGAAGTVTVTAGVPQPAVITQKGYGYTSAPTVTAPGVVGGSGLAAYVATISAAPTATSSFVSSNGGSAVVTVSFPATVRTLPVLVADEYISVNTSAAYCNPPAGSTIAWGETGVTRSVAPKQWILTLEDTVCGTSRLAELQAAYPELVVAEIGTPGDCARAYTTTNYSDPFIDDECAVENYVYHRPDAFFSGANWVAFVATPAVTPVCTTEEVESPCVAAGIKFETAAFVNHTSECLYGYYHYDLSDVDPVYMEITAHSKVNDFTASPCDQTSKIVTKLRETKFATGSGGLIREAEYTTNLQYSKARSTNEARNQAYGLGFTSKPELWYDTYKLTVERNESQHGITGRSGDKQRTTYVFAFPVGKGKSFENLINGYILSLDNEELVPVIL